MKRMMLIMKSLRLKGKIIRVLVLSKKRLRKRKLRNKIRKSVCQKIEISLVIEIKKFMFLHFKRIT